MVIALHTHINNHDYVYAHNNNLQAFQLIVLARYLLGVPKP
jgi:molybdopterin/thiamine biosynthesis adenylyltransferase